jgi:hypothetical protein
MTISLSAILPYLTSATASNSSGGTNGANGATANSALLQAVQAATSGTSNAQDLVTLSSLSGNATNNATQTYNALGLLSGGTSDPLLSPSSNDGSGASLMDDLFGSGSSDSSDAAANIFSQLSSNTPSVASILAKVTGSASGDASAGSTSNVNASLAKALQDDPALATAIAQQTMNQGLTGLLSS